MSEERKAPWGNAQAVIQARDESEKDRWIDLGPVWQNESGSFSFTLESEPLAWRNPNTVRRIVIQKRREPQTTQQQTGGSGGGKSGKR